MIIKKINVSTIKNKNIIITAANLTNNWYYLQHKITKTIIKQIRQEQTAFLKTKRRPLW